MRGHKRAEDPHPTGPATASVRLERLELHSERPNTVNAVEARVVGKTFLGSRMIVDLLVEQAQGAQLKAYVDITTSRAMGDAPIWIGWDTDSMAILSD